MKHEVDYQQMILDQIIKAGGYGAKIEFKNRAGCPDLMVAFPYQDAVLIEVKYDSYKLDPLQLDTHNKLLAGGFQVECLSVRVNSDGLILVTKFNPNDAQPEDWTCELKYLPESLWPDTKMND